MHGNFQQLLYTTRNSFWALERFCIYAKQAYKIIFLFNGRTFYYFVGWWFGGMQNRIEYYFYSRKYTTMVLLKLI